MRKDKASKPFLVPMLVDKGIALTPKSLPTLLGEVSKTLAMRFYQTAPLAMLNERRLASINAAAW